MMTEYRLYQPGDYLKLPWKNGLGFTTELLKQAIDDEVFAWRLSIAQVTRDGPFSNFDGYDRTLVLLSGAGMTLEHGDQASQHLCHPLEAASFPGRGPTSAILHDGAIEDFNIMTRCGLCSAQTFCQAQSSGLERMAAASVLLIYASRHILRVNLDNIPSLQLPLGHLLCANMDQASNYAIDGNGYIAVEISMQD